MAEDTSVFVRGDCTREQVVECVGKMIGHALVPVASAEWPVHQTLAMGLDVRVYDQEGFVDDQGIAFSQFAYVVDMQDLPDAVDEGHRREWRRLFSIVLAGRIAARLRCECIVVDKMQHLLETFHEAGGA